MTPFFLILKLIPIKVENALKVNPSTPRPEGRGLLRVDPERRFFTPAFKGGAWRRRMGQSSTPHFSPFSPELFFHPISKSSLGVIVSNTIGDASIKI